jgi:hypothetical protein
MEKTMANDETEFAQRAAELARAGIEENLIQASRSYEDALRTGDEYSAAAALQNYAAAKRDYDTLAPQQQQSNGQLSNAQRNFLSRRAAGGDQITPQRMADYARGHERALAAGLQPDTPQYFAAVAGHVDHLGDGRIPPLDEREVAKMCGISEREYSQGAAKLAALKRAGNYRESEG